MSKNFYSLGPVIFIYEASKPAFLSLGGYLPPEEIKERFDSNCITPVRMVSTTFTFQKKKLFS